MVGTWGRQEVRCLFGGGGYRRRPSGGCAVVAFRLLVMDGIGSWGSRTHIQIDSSIGTSEMCCVVDIHG